MKIKICGLRREQDVEMLNRCMPDYGGFVFAGKKRKISCEEAAHLRSLLKKEIRTVGVFVNETPDNILRMADGGIIDLIQLHGDETEADIRYLKARTDKPLIKAVRVKSREYVQEMEQLSCDYLLLDTYESGQYGGTGNAFDLSLLPDLKKPFFLAGGLTPQNVQQRLRQMQVLPYGVDISSGVESEGFKDEKKIRQFLAQVRSLPDKQNR